MKKLFAVTICFVLFSSLSFYAVKQPAAAVEVDVEIKDKMFINQMFDLFLNAEDYVGKVIKLSGYFGINQTSDGSTAYSVYREGPGCCGDDGIVGLNVIWDGEYPKDREWVEAIGVVERYKFKQYNSYRLSLSSLAVIAKK